MFSETEHEKLKELCSAYIDGQLSPSERSEFEVHLQSCTECREELASLQETVRLLHRVPMAEVPRSFTLSETQPVKSRSYYTFFKLASGIAAVLLVLVFSLDIFSQTMTLQFAGSAASRSASEAPKTLQSLESAQKDQTSGGAGAASAPPATGQTQPAPQVGARELQEPTPSMTQPNMPSTNEGQQKSPAVKEAKPGESANGKDESSSPAPPVALGNSTPTTQQTSAFRPFEIGLATLLFLLLAGTLIARHLRKRY